MTHHELLIWSTKYRYLCPMSKLYIYYQPNQYYALLIVLIFQVNPYHHRHILTSLQSLSWFHLIYWIQHLFFLSRLFCLLNPIRRSVWSISTNYLTKLQWYLKILFHVSTCVFFFLNIHSYQLRTELRWIIWDEATSLA